MRIAIPLYLLGQSHLSGGFLTETSKEASNWSRSKGGKPQGFLILPLDHFCGKVLKETLYIHI